MLNKDMIASAVQWPGGINWAHMRLMSCPGLRLEIIRDFSANVILRIFAYHKLCRTVGNFSTHSTCRTCTCYHILYIHQLRTSNLMDSLHMNNWYEQLFIEVSAPLRHAFWRPYPWASCIMAVEHKLPAEMLITVHAPDWNTTLIKLELTWMIPQLNQA